MKLCLGTVQFGMDYGIKGQKKPDIEDAIDCLDYATHNGINAIDTARAYGSAEEIVGEFLKRRLVNREDIFISTKFKPNLLDEYTPSEYKRIIQTEAELQLDITRAEYFDAYIFHSARYAFDNEKLEAIFEIKRKGIARKVGVSVYEPEEALACYESPYVDFVQMPYSIFDHRMKKSGVFEPDRIGDCEIHTRSAFLQGLITMDEDKVPPFLEKARPIIRKIDRMCTDENISRVCLAMQYVKREATISHLVFGIDSLDQLKEDIKCFNMNVDAEILDEIDKEFDDIEADLVMPSLWKR